MIDGQRWRGENFSHLARWKSTLNSDSRASMLRLVSQAGFGFNGSNDLSQGGCAITADGESNERPMVCGRREPADGEDRVVG